MAAIHGLSHKALRHFHKYPAALAIYWIYVSRLNNEGVAYPSLNGLVKDTGYAKPTCQKARAWLVECNALEKVDGYIRREWREIDPKDKKRKLDLDKSEYYRPTGYIEVEGERFSLLYYGALEKSEVDYTNDGSPDIPSLNKEVNHREEMLSDGSSGRPSAPLTVNQMNQNLVPVNTELDSIKESDRARKTKAPETTPSEKSTQDQLPQTAQNTPRPAARKLFPLDAAPATYDDGSPVGRETFRLEAHDVFYAYLEGFRLVNRSPLTSIDTLWSKHKSAAVKLAAARITPEQVTAFVVEKYTDTKDTYWQRIDNLISLGTVGTQIRNWIARKQKAKAETAAVWKPITQEDEPREQLTPEQREERIRQGRELRAQTLRNLSMNGKVEENVA